MKQIALLWGQGQELESKTNIKLKELSDLGMKILDIKINDSEVGVHVMILYDKP